MQCSESHRAALAMPTVATHGRHRWAVGAVLTTTGSVLTTTGSAVQCSAAQCRHQSKTEKVTHSRIRVRPLYRKEEKGVRCVV
jgi:hypothetical protein